MISPSIFFEMLYYLIENKRVFRAEIATRFDVSTRTVSRYFNYMVLCGIPVCNSTGKNGGYFLPDEYKLERTFLSGEERARIINCLKATAPNFSDELNEKLAVKFNVLGSGENDKFMLRSDTLIIDAGSWNSPVKSRNKIQAITQAIENNRSMRFEYIDRNETKTEREVDPYCVVLKEGLWYVYGFCRKRNDFRLFKLARMRILFITDDVFLRRPSDVYAKLRGDFGDAELVEFSIAFSNMILPDIEEWLGLDAISENGTQYKATAKMYGGNVLVAKLLSFGSSIEVLSPLALKEELLVECKRTLSVYGLE